jgi:hypothetical protein
MVSPYRAPAQPRLTSIAPGDLYQPLFAPYGHVSFSDDPTLCPPMVITWIFGDETKLVAIGKRLDGRLRMVVKTESLTDPAKWRRM